MARAKVKTVNLGTDGDKEFADMFNSMMGMTEPDPQIIIPKYKKVYDTAMNMLKLFESLLRTTRPFYTLFFEDHQQGFWDIRTFLTQSMAELKKCELSENNDGHVLTAGELTELNSNPDKLREYLENINNRARIGGLQEKWKELKDCSVVQNFILIARNLKTLLKDEKLRSKSTTHNLEDKKNLSLNFIKNSVGDYLHIFEFSSLDFKQVTLSDKMNPDLEQYLALFLHLLYKDTLVIVETISMPDINIDEFTELLSSKIDGCRKMVPRCDRAFNKIGESIDMLKSNFPMYYKDFIISQSNPGIIIENYIIDVAGTCSNEPELVRQFRTIVSFIQQQSAHAKQKDPRVAKLFGSLSKNLDLLEKKEK